MSWWPLSLQLRGVVRFHEIAINVDISSVSNISGPCKAIAPLLDQLQTTFNTVKFIEVDVDANADISRQNGVTAMPTLVLFHNEVETTRVTGADPSAIRHAISELSKMSSGSNPSSSGGSSSSIKSEIKPLIAKGFETLNDSVHISGSEALNIDPESGSISTLLDLSANDESKPIISFADSQIMLYLPLHNKTKLYSILIKDAVDTSKESTQRASKIKIWANTTGTISFDDATAGGNALHDSEIPEPTESGWSEIKPRYVRFQNVGSLLIFLDGEDEDAQTLIQKLVLVGSKGDSRDQGKIEKIDTE